MKNLILVALLTLSFGANAALVSSLGGLAYYDTDTDLTWLADANYAKTSGSYADGLMNWQDANDWAAQLTVDGVSGWRLPDYNSAELYNLYYDGKMSAPFINIQNGEYWYATEDVWLGSGSPPYAWLLNLRYGGQYSDDKNMRFNAWAVQSGNVGNVVSAVPVPAAVWLFGTGLIGLIGVARRKA